MQTPEILLQDLNEALRRLRGALHLLGDTQLDTELRPVLRRLLVAEVLGKTSILAIGGSQGSGKTTLLCSLYALQGADAHWLEPNEGRGERLPVLVCEEPGRQEAQGAIRRLKRQGERYELVEDEVDVTTFHAAVRDQDPEALLPVLKVPARYFSGANQAWMLLPGYEKQNRGNAAWQHLMRQALVAASGCIIVTDETRLANQQQLEIVRDMLANELRHAQSLVVVSKTEAMSRDPQRLAALRRTAQQVFQMTPEQGERWVVCAGADDAAYVEQWLPVLQSAINALVRSSGGDRKAQLARLEDLLSRDLTRVMTLIQNKAQLFYMQAQGGEGGARDVLRNCLDAFDDARDGLRNRYQEEIHSALSTQYDSAWTHLQAWMTEHQEGLLNRFSEFFRGATESAQRIESAVTRAWKSPEEVLEKHALAVARVTQQALGAPEGVSQAGHSVGSGTVLQRLGYVDAQNKPLAWAHPDAEDQHNLSVLLCKKKEKEGAQAGKGFERAVKLLPALTLEYARVASLMPALVGVSTGVLNPVSQADRADLVRQATQQFGQGVELGKTLLRSVATVLAVDVGTDGDVDVIPALLHAVGLGTSSTEGSTATAAGGAALSGGVGAATVGLVAVGYLVFSSLQEVRRHDENARTLVQSMLRTIQDHHQRHFMRHFDELMDRTRERMVQALRARYRLDEKLMEQDRLAKSIADVLSVRRDLLDELARSGRSLALFSDEAEEVVA